MKKRNPLGLTPEELAELQAFDAEVDQDDELTCAELAGARQRDREHQEAHASNHLQRQREYNRAHREQRRVQARKDYWRNPEKHREASRRWYKNHPQQRKEYARAYRQEHRDEYRERENNNRTVWEPYGLRIKQARKARGWSQKELGARLGGICNQAVAKYETGRRPIDWERFRAVLPEIGPQPENYPHRNTRPGPARQWKGEEE